MFPVMLIIVFTIVATIFWGLSDFYLQRTSRAFGNIEVLALIGICGSILLLPFIWNDFSTFNSWQLIFLLVGLAVISTVATIYDCEALKQGKLSVVDLVYQIELPITVILGFIFFGEILLLWQYGLIFAIILGLILLTVNSLHNFSLKIEAGVFLAAISASLFGLVNFLTASASRSVSPLMAVWFPWMFFTITAVAVLLKRKGFPRFINHIRQKTKIAVLVVLTNAIGWIAYAYAVRDGNLSIIAAITASYPAIALFLGIYINKEEIKTHQYLGAAVALGAGIILAIYL